MANINLSWCIYLQPFTQGRPSASSICTIWKASLHWNALAGILIWKTWHYWKFGTCIYLWPLELNLYIYIYKCTHKYKYFIYIRTFFKSLFSSENSGIILHHSLHVQSYFWSRQVAIGIPKLIQPAYCLFSSIGRKIILWFPCCNNRTLLGKR